jgi:low temperature requirement protein LtrA
VPGQEKRVTWVELFFDLVFVVAVTQVSGVLHDNHSWSGVARALVVFIPIYWAWVGMTMHANLHDVDRTRARLGVFAVGLGGLFMAWHCPRPTSHAVCCSGPATGRRDCCCMR